MARVGGINIPDNKHVDVSLTQFMVLEEKQHKIFAIS